MQRQREQQHHTFSAIGCHGIVADVRVVKVGTIWGFTASTDSTVRTG